MHTVVFLPWGRGIICRKIYFYRICVFRKWEGGRGEQPKEGRVWEGIAPSNTREFLHSEIQSKRSHNSVGIIVWNIVYPKKMTGNLYTFTEHVSPTVLFTKLYRLGYITN